MIKNGFTLVEILIVMAIMASIGTVLLTTFVNTLKGSNKSQILAAIKQNGQTVLDNLSKNIRDADHIVCPLFTTNPNQVTSDTLVIAKDGVYTRYRFIAPSPASNGLVQQDSPVKQTVQGTTREETDAEFVSRICSPTSTTDSSANLSILTDTNPQSGISVQYSVISGTNEPVFTRDKIAGFKDSITIQFTLRPGVGVAAGVASQIDDVKFQTTVHLR